MKFKDLLRLAKERGVDVSGMLDIQKLAKGQHYKGRVGFNPYYTWREWLKYWEDLYTKRRL